MAGRGDCRRAAAGLHSSCMQRRCSCHSWFSSGSSAPIGRVGMSTCRIKEGCARNRPAARPAWCSGATRAERSRTSMRTTCLRRRCWPAGLPRRRAQTPRRTWLHDQSARCTERRWLRFAPMAFPVNGSRGTKDRNRSARIVAFAAWPSRPGHHCSVCAARSPRTVLPSPRSLSIGHPQGALSAARSGSRSRRPVDTCR